MGDLSKNFSKSEFLCPCGKCDGGTMSPAFIAKLQSLREKSGVGMTVISGFRCPAHNKKEGGATASLHLEGRACDVLCASDRDRLALVRYAIDVGLRGIGINNGSIHFDDRETGAIWTYYTKKHAA